MGTVIHSTVIVTGPLATDLPHNIPVAHGMAQRLGCAVTAIYPSEINGFGTFFLVPTGSKSGWEMAIAEAQARGRFVEWLDVQRYDDGGSHLEWVELEYGRDMRGVLGTGRGVNVIATVSDGDDDFSSEGLVAGAHHRAAVRWEDWG